MSSLRTAAALLLSLCACSCAHAGAAGPTAFAGNAPPDAIVVLGHRPPLAADGLEYETRMRVEHGVALYRERQSPWLLFSGGPSTPQAVEADVMARFAEQHGVAASALLRERNSRDTIENARLSVQLLRERLAITRAPRVLLVTSDYHSERAAHLFRCAGAEVVTAPVTLQLSKSERARRKRSERWVRFYYRFIDECARARG